MPRRQGPQGPQRPQGPIGPQGPIERLCEYANKHGLSLVRVPGDGNCLFSSLVMFFRSKGIAADIRGLKEVICRQAAEEPGLIRDLPGWTRAVMQDGTYGDATVLYLVQRAFSKYQFLVYDLEDDGPCYNQSHLFIREADAAKLDSLGAKALVRKSRKIRGNWCILLFSGYNHYDLLLQGSAQ